MIAHRYLAALLLLVASTAVVASTTVYFASSRAAVPLPDSFRVTVSGDNLVATFRPDADHTLELSLSAHLSKSGSNRSLGVEFVESQAQKRGAKAQRAGDRAVFSEPGSKDVRDNKTFQSMHWQIGIANCVFAMTLTAPLPMSKELDEFLSKSLNNIVRELSCNEP